MDLTLSPQSVTLHYPVKTIDDNDVNELGQLLWQVDQNSIDNNGQDVLGSIAEIQEMLDGHFGTFLTAASFVLFDSQKPICATFWTHYPKENQPLLAMTMTHPSYQNRGLCQLLIRHSFNALQELGYTTCFLSVTQGNSSAIAAYEKIGFKKRIGSDRIVKA